MGKAYRADIDGLRALAVVPVVLFHAFPARLPGGFIGVDVFFVISGFLITSIIQKRQDAGVFSLRGFYAARVKRIFPALAIMLAAALAAGWHIMSAKAYADLGRHVIGAVGFVANILFWQDVNYFGPSAIEQPLLHLWSLGVEEQFYLVWPLTMIVAAKVGCSRFRIALAVALLSFAYNIWLTGIDPPAAFYLPFGRAWELMAGALIALRAPAPSMPVRHGASVLGLALLVGGYAMIDATVPFPGWRALVPCVASLLLIAAGRDAVINRLLSNRLLVGIGLISYPLYLWHWPLLSFAAIVNFGEAPSGAIRAALVLAAFGLATATYCIVERPAAVRRYLTPVSLIGAMACVAVAGLLILPGVPSRAAARDQRRAFVDRYETLRTTGLTGPYRLECDFYDVPTKGQKAIAPACFQRGSTATDFLWGDSHAQALALGLRSILPPGTALAQVATSGCAPALVPNDRPSPGNACPRSTLVALDAIGRLKPNTVFLAQQHDHERTDWSGIARVLKRRGVRTIVLFGPVPEWSPDLPKLFAYHYMGTGARQSRIGVSPDILRTDRLLTARYAHSRDLVYISLVDKLCHRGDCLMKVPGTEWLTAVDYGHLTPAASLYVARTIIAPALYPDHATPLAASALEAARRP